MASYEYIRDMEIEYHKKYADSILLVLNGNFYNAYGKDAYILSYVFSFKFINKAYTTEEDKEITIPRVGFPRNSLDRVLIDLEEKKINYVIKVKEKNDIYKDFKKLNTYKRKYEASEKYCMDKTRVNEITNECNNLCGKKDFSSVLDKIYDYIEKYKEQIN